MSWNQKKLVASALSGVIVVGAMVAGCTVGPNYKTPEMKLPDQYGLSTTQPTTQSSTQPTTQVVLPNAWWTTFNDPALNQIIEQTAKSNLDLQAAEARVREARAQRQIAASAYYPTVNSGANYTRSRNSQNAINGAPAGTIPTEQDYWQAGFDASWEVDVFGGIRRAVQATDADIQAAVANRDAVMLSLLGEVARNYMELRGSQRQIDITIENIKAQQDTLDLTRAKFDAGLTTDADVARQEAQVASTQSQIPKLETRAQQAIYRLSVLTAREPRALEAALGPPQPIPAPPPEIPAGIPSDLLRRRPDIQVAERQLAGQTARIGVATADLFPRFTILGDLGLSSNKFSSLANSSSIFWSIAPTVSWPVFNAGRIKANIEVQTARTDQLLANYEQTILNSLEEVESAMVAYQKEFVRRASLAKAVAANQRAVSLSQQLYQQGLSNFLDVLDAQRALFLSQNDLAISDTEVSSNAVALFKALGGGWDAEELAPKPPAEKAESEKDNAVSAVSE